jgi:hypothetical protein
MSFITRCRSLWRNVVHRDRVDSDLHDEVRTAFDMLVDDNARRGMTPPEARRAAT